MNQGSRPEASHAPGGIARPAWLFSLLQPVKSFRVSYLPVLMVYFAYGALGVIDVTRDLWIKESLTLTPSQLAAIAVWLNLPWTVKMVFGELVDCVPIFRSQRGSYVLIGASFTACGMLTLAGAAGGWITVAPLNRLYVWGALLIVVGAVIQDVVADAMSTEVVARIDETGAPRSEHDVRAELGMVQVLGRLAVSAGILMVAGLSGWLASLVSRESVFLLALFVPVISITGVFIRRHTPAERRPIDWRILGGGIVFGAIVVALGISNIPLAEELTFAISMFVICGMLFLVTRELSPETQRAILFTSIVIFVFRASPNAGDGLFWWTLDVLKLDAQFYGVIRQVSAIVGIAALWMLSRQITEYSVVSVLLWITVAETLLSLPSIGLFYGLHEWTEATFGFGARTIMLIDSAAVSPFDQFSMVPLLTLIAFYAPQGQRATWFALMASLMNLALIAGQLQTKYLNDIFVVQRGEYTELGPLLIWAMVIGFVVPILAIVAFGKRIARN
jgi:BT1 family